MANKWIAIKALYRKIWTKTRDRDGEVQPTPGTKYPGFRQSHRGLNAIKNQGGPNVNWNF